jgi:hypothetical protein
VNTAIAAGGVDAIVSEVTRHGTEGDKECLEYVLHAEAGSSALTFQGGLKRDCGPDGVLLECRVLKDDIGASSPAGVGKTVTPHPSRGMRIDDFVRTPQVLHARLTKAHVVALRLYSTAVSCLPSSPPPCPSLYSLSFLRRTVHEQVEQLGHYRAYWREGWVLGLGGAEGR